MTEQLRLFQDEVKALHAYPPLWVEGKPLSKGAINWWARGWVDWVVAQIVDGWVKKSTIKVLARAFPAKDKAAKLAKEWEDTIAQDVWDSWDRPVIDEGCVGISLCFYFLRPLSHYRTGKYEKDLRKDAPGVRAYAKKPDGDKLSRAPLDALTGIVYKDDCQVDPLFVTRKYACRFEGGEGVEIRIYV